MQDKNSPNSVEFGLNLYSSADISCLLLIKMLIILIVALLMLLLGNENYFDFRVKYKDLLMFYSALLGDANVKRNQNIANLQKTKGSKGKKYGKQTTC